MARVFGEIPGNQVGTLYENCAAAANAGVHKPLIAGISGAAADGADSIGEVVAMKTMRTCGGVIVYIGAGGQDSSGNQVADQEFTRTNLALVRSAEGLPVRVIRGAGGDPGTRPH